MLLIHPPLMCLRMEPILAQIFGSMPLVWETWMEFLDLCFSLTIAAVHSAKQQMEDAMSVSPPLFPSLFFSSLSSPFKTIGIQIDLFSQKLSCSLQKRQSLKFGLDKVPYSSLCLVHSGFLTNRVIKNVFKVLDLS